MMTFFTMPKHMRGHFDIIQRNAITSWTNLDPRPEIILMGNDEGVAELACELNLKHCPEIDTNEHGTPLVSSLFEQAHRNGSHDVFNYINSDIILLEDFAKAFELTAQQSTPFLFSGRRHDIDITEPIDFSYPDWRDRLRQCVREAGTLHHNSGVDYFVYSRGVFDTMPPFAIGRTAYDNWFFWHCRSRKVPIIDISNAIVSIHQNHDRTYQSVGIQHPDKTADLRKGNEAAHNVKLAGGPLHLYKIMDASHRIDSNWLIHPVSGSAYWPYAVRRFFFTTPGFREISRLAMKVYRRVRKLPGA